MAKMVAVLEGLLQWQNRARIGNMCRARSDSNKKNAQKNKLFDVRVGGIGRGRGAILTALRGALGKRAGCIKHHFANSFALKWRFSY
ncbi:hypothetical protein HQ398_08190 [Aeromonas jandaei]|nr:hypothetical protein HQ398_08190 [Aeromonas jandaei]